MSFDNPEYDLLAAFKARFGLSEPLSAELDLPPDTGVLSSCEHVYNNAIDVSISMAGTKAAARSIYKLMKERAYSTDNWSAHELHPNPNLIGAEECIRFIFTLDLLNFSFWSAGNEKFTVEYKSKQWTGYYSLAAALHRALDEGVPITSSDFWQNEEECTVEVLEHVFRSSTNETIPLFDERIRCLREAGQILYQKYECSPLNILRQARSSARRLVHLLEKDFQAIFSDRATYPPDSTDRSDQVRFQKRAQILAADLWACFQDTTSIDHNVRIQEPASNHEESNAQDIAELPTEHTKPAEKDVGVSSEIKSLTDFDDIDYLTTFPDYRIPQMLCCLGVLEYSPILTGKIAKGQLLESGGAWEVEIRGCAVWAVEMLRRQIVELQRLELDTDQSANTQPRINSVLIDFFLYDLCKEMEHNGELDLADVLQHHRTRSIWY